MYLKHNINAFFKTSWLKTIYFNLYYFGFKGFRLPIFVARNIRLKKVKGKVLLKGHPCKRIMLGRDNCSHVFDKGVWDNEGTVIFGNRCLLGNGTKIAVLKGATLTFGNEVYITGNTRILCEHSITIDNKVAISWDTTIMDSDHHKVYNEEGKCINMPKAIVIGPKSWIGIGAIILKGARLPKESIVAAGSIISKEFVEPHCVIGNTNQIIKQKTFWEP